jgi:hypothetical protein
MGEDEAAKLKEQGGMGFRDLYSFNLAMLSRQAWRLLQDPDSLCGRVLRAKYFPNGDILSAVPVSGMSYIWRSILKGIEVIREGMIWRVGSGENIRIWDDPWVLRGPTRRPRSNQGHHLLTRVVELIKPDVHEWDEQLVRQTFSAEDADAILCIPICEQHDDFVAWHYDSKGLFSVTSAYRVHVDMLLRQSNVQRGENSSGSAWREKVWQAIWSVNCPAKVHHFLWRFAHNSHPLRMNIARRGVELDTRCTVRCRLFEDGRHLFLRCKEVKNFWRSIQLE